MSCGLNLYDTFIISTQEKLFDELLTSVREGVSILRDEKPPARTFAIEKKADKHSDVLRDAVPPKKQSAAKKIPKRKKNR